MIESEEMKRAGMEVKEPVRKRTMVMLYDVEVALTNEEVVSENHKRNLKGDFTEEEMKEEFKIRSRIVEGKGDRKKKIGSLAVERNGRMRNVLRKRERVFVGWTSSRPKDYIDLPRCYRRQRFAHVAKFCNSRKVCPRCAEEHDIRECKRTEEATRRCVNSLRDGITELNHDEPYTKGGRVVVAGASVLQERMVSEEQVWTAVVVLDDSVQVFGRDDESNRCCMVVDVKEELRRVLRRRRGKRVFIAGNFNAKSEVWYASKLNERGERVEEFVMSESLEVMNERRYKRKSFKHRNYDGNDGCQQNVHRKESAGRDNEGHRMEISELQVEGEEGEEIFRRIEETLRRAAEETFPTLTGKDARCPLSNEALEEMKRRMRTVLLRWRRRRTEERRMEYVEERIRRRGNTVKDGGWRGRAMGTCVQNHWREVEEGGAAGRRHEGRRDGMCRKCGQHETSQHVLMECEAYEEERGELRRYVDERGVEWERKSFVETEESVEIF
ncbi:hypothetical protein J6590_088894 [Homalodisca vitripennis]|nr:hypothetical protein J6590_088894 [Homalodisca vitripennis]